MLVSARRRTEPGELTRWAGTFKDQGWDDVFVFFKHEDEGAGPVLADLFVEGSGIELTMCVTGERRAQLRGTSQ